MRRIGGHEQRGLPGMARGKMQRQRAGYGRLAHTAFPDDKRQLSHREIVCGKGTFDRKGTRGAKVYEERREDILSL